MIICCKTNSDSVGKSIFKLKVRETVEGRGPLIKTASKPTGQGETEKERR